MGHSDSIELASLCGQCVSHTPSILEGASAGRLCCCCILLPPVNKATTLLLVIYGLELRVFFVWLLTSCSVAFSCICSQPAQSSCYQLPYHSALSQVALLSRIGSRATRHRWLGKGSINHGNQRPGHPTEAQQATEVLRRTRLYRRRRISPGSQAASGTAAPPRHSGSNPDHLCAGGSCPPGNDPTSCGRDQHSQQNI